MFVDVAVVVVVVDVVVVVVIFFGRHIRLDSIVWPVIGKNYEMKFKGTIL